MYCEGRRGLFSPLSQKKRDKIKSDLEKKPGESAEGRRSDSRFLLTGTCSDRYTEPERMKKMEHDLKVIARIRSPFPEKFGIPRQSGLVENRRERLSLNRNTGIRMPFGGWRNFPISGLSGNFQKIRGRSGRPRCVRPAWEEMCAEEFLLPAHLFVPILWDYPVSR